MRALVLAIVVAACGPVTVIPCRDHVAPGELVISEVFARYAAPPGASGGDGGHQWFEIYNASERALDVSGMEIASTRGTTELRHRVGQLVIAPHQYATLGDVDDHTLPPYLDYGYGDELGAFADTGTGTVALRCGSTEITHTDYGDAQPGHSRELASPADPASWCDAQTVFEPSNYGTPRVASDCIPAGQCFEGGVARPLVSPHAGDLAITEVMPSPTKVADTSGEWIEVLAHADVDLAGMAVDRVHDNREPDPLPAATCGRVTAGTYVVLARSSDATANGGLPPVAGTFKLSLVAGTTAAPGDVRLVAGDEVIDAVTWTGATDGAARSLDPSAGTWCDAASPYGAGDLGTPGAANPPCPNTR